jgi:hypothetical protein
MQVYHYDEETKEFLYEEKAYIDPLETELKGKDIFLLPANATFLEPLSKKEGFKVVFDGEKWKYAEIKIEVEETPKEPTNEDISQMRQMAYVKKTDPLTLRKLRKQALCKWTEEDEKEYISKIQSISAQIASEFPYISEEPAL